MTDYERCIRQARELKERNDCAVIATSIVTCQEYDDVHKLFVKHGRHPGGRTPVNVTLRVLKDLGRGLKDVTKLYNSRTVTTLERELFGHEVLMVRVRGHVLAVRDGHVHDWTRGRRHRINQVLRVVTK